MDIRSYKNELRDFFAKKRNALSSSEKSILDKKISDRLISMSVFKSSNQILLYASTDEEISTESILR